MSKAGHKDPPWRCRAKQEASRNLVKDWNTKYERLTNMIVPRSSTYVPKAQPIFYVTEERLNRVVASDDEYTLNAVVIFRRVRDEFVQKCRENK